MLRNLGTPRAFVVVAVVALVTAGLLACAAWRGRIDPPRPTENAARADAQQPRAASAVPIMSRAPRTPVPPPSNSPGPLAPVTVSPPATPTDVIPPSLIAEHRVGPGETLKRIAARYRVTSDFLMTLNGIARPDRISSGAILKVVQGPFSAVIDKSAFRLDVFLGNTLYRRFAVGLGANGSTPTGTWKVKDKLTNPSWSNPKTHQRYAADDPANPIGEYWLGLEGLSGEALGKMGFGIHGTIEPDSIGRNASLGCVRLRSPDIAAVYSLLVEGASTVEIR